MQHDYNFVADESVDLNLVKFLRNKGLVIFSIMEEVPSLNDKIVLELAVQKNAILITEDKDFGELVYKLKLPHKGLLLLRLENIPDDKFEIIYLFITKYAADLSKFCGIKKPTLTNQKIPLACLPSFSKS